MYEVYLIAKYIFFRKFIFINKLYFRKMFTRNNCVIIYPIANLHSSAIAFLLPEYYS